MLLTEIGTERIVILDKELGEKLNQLWTYCLSGNLNHTQMIGRILRMILPRFLSLGDSMKH